MTFLGPPSLPSRIESRECSSTNLVSALHRLFYFHLASRNCGLHAAVIASVAEVNEHNDGKPDNQAQPGAEGQTHHHQASHQDSHDWHEWNPWGFEGTSQFWTAHAQDPHAGTDDHKRQQRADAHQFAENSYGDQGGENRHEGSYSDAGDPGSAETRMHRARPLRQESIARHGKEDARLPKEQHQHYATQTRDGTEFHENGAP